jgi:hypothetical protein
LKEIKGKYDPGNVFSNPQSVGQDDKAVAKIKITLSGTQVLTPLSGSVMSDQVKPKTSRNATTADSGGLRKILG